MKEFLKDCRTGKAAAYITTVGENGKERQGNRKAPVRARAYAVRKFYVPEYFVWLNESVR